ncbi:hypothetical protein DICA4_E22276 [Diutina catenulata]
MRTRPAAAPSAKGLAVLKNFLWRYVRRGPYPSLTAMVTPATALPQPPPRPTPGPHSLLLQHFYRLLYPARPPTAPPLAPPQPQAKLIDVATNKAKYDYVHHDDLYDAYTKLPPGTPLAPAVRRHLVDSFVWGKRDFTTPNGVTGASPSVSRDAFNDMLQKRQRFVGQVQRVVADYSAAAAADPSVPPLDPSVVAQVVYYSFFKDRDDVIAKVADPAADGPMDGLNHTRRDDHHVSPYPEFSMATWELLKAQYSHAQLRPCLAPVVLHAHRHHLLEVQAAVQAWARQHPPVPHACLRTMLDEGAPTLEVARAMVRRDRGAPVDVHTINAVLERVWGEDPGAAAELTAAVFVPGQMHFDEGYPPQLQYTASETRRYRELVARAPGQFQVVPTEKTFRMWLAHLVDDPHAEYAAVEAVVARMEQFGLVPSTKTWLVLFGRWPARWGRGALTELTHLLVALHTQLWGATHDGARPSLEGVPPELQQALAPRYAIDHLPTHRAALVKLTDPLMAAVFAAHIEAAPRHRQREVHRLHQEMEERVRRAAPGARVYTQASVRAQARVEEIQWIRKGYLMRLVNMEEVIE